jgi:PAS domain S-box-containing protein
VLTDSVPISVAYVDREHRYRYVNAAFEKRWGRPRSDILGRHVREVLGEAVYAEALPHMEAALQGETVRYELEVPYAAGTRYMAVTYVPRTDAEGNVLGVGALIGDITELRSAEKLMEQQRERMERLARQTTLGAFAGTLAHELNQPLAAILSNAQAAVHLLTRDPPDVAEAGAALADIVRDDKRAASVLRNMRDLLRGNRATTAPVNLGPVVNAAMGFLAKEARARRVTVEYKPARELPPVAGDAGQIEQLLVNVLLNALQATDRASRGVRKVVVRARATARDGVQVSVRDSGVGVEEESLAHLFEPFFTTKNEGMGLGLWLCRSIAEAHGGRIWVTRNPSRGVTVHFTLPTYTGEPT